MGMETALDEVKMKEEQKNVPSLDEEEKSKVSDSKEGITQGLMSHFLVDSVTIFNILNIFALIDNVCGFCNPVIMSSIYIAT